MKTYAELLRDPRWQRKRLEILNRDNWFCQACVDRDSTLHVHHIKYEGDFPWETPDNLLVTLCESCHKKEEELKNFDYYSLIAEVGLTRKDLIIIIEHIRFRMLHPQNDDTAFWILNREVMPRFLDKHEHDTYVKYVLNGYKKIETEGVNG